MTSDSKQKQAGPVSAGFPWATGLDQSAIFAMPHQIADFWLKLGVEWLGFLSHRLCAQAELLSRLRACPDLDSVVVAEARFFENAADDYGQEIDRLADAARGTLEPEQASTGRPRKKAVSRA